MKKWLIPLTFPFLTVIAHLLSGVVALCLSGKDLGGVIVVLYGIIAYCLIGVPIICILYSKRCLTGQRFRFLFTVYQSFLISLPYIILFSFLIAEPRVLFGLIFFAWCELWGLIGLVRFKRKTKKQNL